MQRMKINYKFVINIIACKLVSKSIQNLKIKNSASKKL